MSEIIEKTYKLLDTLDNSEVIKKLTYYKEKLSQDEEVLSLVEKINQENNDAVKKIIEVALKNNKTYVMAIGAITNIALAIKKAPEIIDKIEII